MAESKFIRSMTLAVAIAKAGDEDISEKMLAQSEVEENPVRRGILKLISDRRFLSRVSPVMMWQEDAATELEEFADSLEIEHKSGMLTEERIKSLIEEFLSIWSMMMQNRKPVYESSRKARKKARMQAVERRRGESGDDGDGSTGYRMGSRAGKKDIDEALSEFVEEYPKDEDVLPGGSEGIGIGAGDPKIEEHKRENLFLRSIPESLKRLAMLIGRVGESEMGTKGRFLTASKSDIEGITVGNNLSALLPSEVAMLSGKATEDIFYRNFAEKRLQVFASASQSAAPQIRKDGPVIICVDESSSMSGEPLRIAITLAYAVIIIAKRKHRQVLIVAYSDSHKLLKVESLGRQRKQLLDFLSNVSMGGNNENSMFEWLFREILPHEEKFRTADILCISDFGWVPIDKYVKVLIDVQKAAGMRFYGLNIGGAFGYWQNFDDSSWNSPMAVCDSLWEYHNGQCKEVKKN